MQLLETTYSSDETTYTLQVDPQYLREIAGDVVLDARLLGREYDSGLQALEEEDLVHECHEGLVDDVLGGLRGVVGGVQPSTYLEECPSQLWNVIERTADLLIDGGVQCEPTVRVEVSDDLVIEVKDEWIPV